jgi:hypothetical protein
MKEKTKSRTAVSRKPVAWPQLCAIARSQIETSPTIDDFEWAERIKCRLARLGFDYPLPERLTDAMRAVERALVKEWGPRPLPMPPAPLEATQEVLHQADPPWPHRRQPPGWTTLQELLTSLKPSGNSGGSSRS